MQNKTNPPLKTEDEFKQRAMGRIIEVGTMAYEIGILGMTDEKFRRLFEYGPIILSHFDKKYAAKKKRQLK